MKQLGISRKAKRVKKMQFVPEQITVSNIQNEEHRFGGGCILIFCLAAKPKNITVSFQILTRGLYT